MTLIWSRTGMSSSAIAFPNKRQDGAFQQPCLPWSAEARDVDRLLGDELEERGGAVAGLLDATADRRHDLLWLSDAFAIAPERLGEVGVMATDVGRSVFLGRDRHHLQFDRHREIVHQDRQDRNALAHCGLEIHAGKADRRITPDIDAELV